jgi:hypothetical protein
MFGSYLLKINVVDYILTPILFKDNGYVLVEKQFEVDDEYVLVEQIKTDECALVKQIEDDEYVLVDEDLKQ